MYIPRSHDGQHSRRGEETIPADEEVGMNGARRERMVELIDDCFTIWQLCLVHLNHWYVCYV